MRGHHSHPALQIHNNAVDRRPDQNDQKRRQTENHRAQGQFGWKRAGLFFGAHHALVAHFVGIDA